MCTAALFVICQAWKPQMYNNRWLDKQTVLNPQKGIPLSNTREWAIHPGHNSTESQINYAWVKEYRPLPPNTTYCINLYLLNSRECTLTYNDRNQISGCLGWEEKGWPGWEGGKIKKHRTLWEVTDMSIILIVVGISQVYNISSFIKLYTFTVCAVYRTPTMPQ